MDLRTRLLVQPLEDRLAPATFTVNALTDTGAGSGTTGDLRYCITQSDATTGPNTIDATGVRGSIILTSSLPSIRQGLTIDGPGSALLTINANGTGRDFTQQANTSLTVSGVTLTGAVAGHNGGGISGREGSLTVQNSVLTGNASGTGGGAIYWSYGSVTIMDSTISSNNGGRVGGGIDYIGDIPVTISNSTIINNTATYGGGIEFGTFGRANITSSTITENTAFRAGGGISGYRAQLKLNDSVVSGNVLTSGGYSDFDYNGAQIAGLLGGGLPPLVLASFSALGTSTGYTLYAGSANNLPIGSVLNLGPLTIASGPNGTYPVIPLNPGSAAIDAGDPSLAGTADEIGTTRPQGAGVDIGAIEQVSGVPNATATAANVMTAGATTYQFSVTYTDATAINVSTIAIDSNDVTVTPPTGVAPVTVTLVPGSITPNSNAPSVTATYQFSVPGGGWSSADRGAYAISMAANQVDNSAGVAVPAGVIGSFLVAPATTYIVTNTNDSGPGSLRQAILNTTADADILPNTPPPDMIVFSNMTAGGTQTNFYDGGQHTINLQSSLPTIVDPVTITGPGAAVLVIASATNTFQMFNLKSPTGTTVTMGGMTITGGYVASGSGGAIGETGGNLTLVNDLLSNNTAFAGGGVAVEGTGVTVSITNTVMTGNDGFGGGDGYGGGGAVAVGGSGDTITITNSTMTGDTGRIGGAIYLYGATGTCTLTTCTLANNSAEDGGAIFSDRGIVLTIAESTLSGNTAGGGLGWGGAVYSDGFYASTISDCTIANNGAAIGGGIYVGSSTGTLELVSSTVTGNIATLTAGGEYGGGGGGIYAVNGIVSLDNTIVSGNSIAPASSGPDIWARASVAVSAQYSAIGASAGVTLTDLGHNLAAASATSAALGLEALNDYGGLTETVALTGSSSAIGMGDPALNGTKDQRGVTRPQQIGPAPRPDIGAFERIPAIPTAIGSTANVTSTAAPAVYQFTVTYADDTAMLYSSIDNNNNAVTVTGTLNNGGTVNPTVAFVSATPTSNAASITAAYQFTAPGGAWTGADNGLYTVNMAANQVENVNGVFVPFGLPPAISALHVAIPTTYTVTNTNDSGVGSLRQAIVNVNADAAVNPSAPAADAIAFSNTTAGGTRTNFYDGGQHTISLLSALPAIVDAVTITGPAAVGVTVERATGAFQIFNVNSGSGNTVTMSGMTISNGIGADGAGITETSGNLTLSNMVLTGNSASNDGGAIGMTAAGAMLTLINDALLNNTAGVGGGVAVEGTGDTVTISNTAMTGNEGGGYHGGGALVVGGSGDTVSIANATITGNSGFVGGAVSLYDSTATCVLRNCTLSNNTAGKGGAIYLDNANALTIADSTLSGNTAWLGGAIYSINVLYASSIDDCTIANNTAATGGGIFVTGPGKLNLVSSTVTSNIATSDTAIAGYRDGGGVELGNAAVFLDNTVISGNSAPPGDNGPDITSLPGATVSAQYSALGTTTGYTLTDLGHNLTGASATPAALKLQPLAENGGPTQTVALGSVSAAINAGDPATTLTTDQRGLPRTYGPAPDIGAYEVQPPAVASVQVNDGSAQRSEVRSITVTFNEPVSFAGGNVAAAFQLQHVQDSTSVANLQAAVSANQMSVTLTFTMTGNSSNEIDPVSAMNGGAASLANGRFQLTVFAANVTGPDGVNLAGGGPNGNYVSPTDTPGGGPGQLQLYRLYGDANGNGIVDALDLGQLRTTYNMGTGNPLYLAYLDADNSGFVDSQDLGQLRTRYNTSVFS